MKNISFKAGIGIATFVIGVSFTAVWIKTESEHLPDSAVESQEGTVTVTNVPPVNEESEDYAVYSVVLNDLFVKAGFGSVIVFDQTSETFDRSRSNTRPNIYPKFDLPVRYVLIDENEYEDYLFDDSKQKQNRKKAMSDLVAGLPKPATVRLSRVAFNDDGTTAKVSVEYVYCPLCGFGDTVSLEKTEGVWTIKEISEDWIS